MGREIKRVPIGFNWPLGKVWQGFLRPDELDLPVCPDCDGRGDTMAARWLDSVLYLVLMLDDDIDNQKRGQALHPYLATLMNNPGGRPSADITELAVGLAGRGASFMGHDAINHWKAYAAVVKAAGMPETWGQCSACSGEGYVATAEQRAAHDAWKSSEPPTGDGWQIWETVSEGSPISPAFATAEELATWMSNPDRTDRYARDWMPYPAAMQFIKAGWAPTFVSSASTGLVQGSEWIGMADNQDGAR